MKRTLLLLGTLSLFAVGCAATSRAPASAISSETTLANASEAGPDRADESVDEEASAETVATRTRATETARKPGDFVVYKFTGSFRGGPLTLTERVVERDEAAIVIDMELSGADRARTLRVTMSDAGPTRGEVLRVERLRAGALSPATIAEYEELMAQVTLSADQNEAALGSEDTVVAIGDAKLACRTSSYAVKIGERAATLRTIQSEGFAWGDVGGDITAKDGSLLYRAEVVAMGSKAAPSAATLAQNTYDD